MTDSVPRRANRRVRVEDVALAAGVSPITVSRVLRTPDKVRPKTRERVLEAVAASGYVVNPIASSLRSGRSAIVSVFVASLQNPHFAAAMQGALDAFEGSRFHLMFAQTGYSEQLSADVVETLLPFHPAGVMFTGVVRRDDTRTALRSLGVPVVEMWGDRPDPIDMLVGSSGYAGGRLMGAHFGARGYKRIAFSGHTLERGNARLEGFRDGLAEFGAEVALVVPKEGTRGVADGMAALDEIVARMPDCDAAFFGTDVLAVGALLAARRHGLDVPGRLALAGYGDLEFTALIEPTLTSIHVADYDMGRMAGDMLLRRLNGQPVETPIVHVPVHLEARRSTQPA